jgi:hypothetical protein
MLMPVFYSKSRLASLLAVDARTVAYRIKTLRIEPDAVTANGRPLYGQKALESLRVRSALAHTFFKEAPGALCGPAPKSTSDTTPASIT